MTEVPAGVDAPDAEGASPEAGAPLVTTPRRHAPLWLWSALLLAVALGIGMGFWLFASQKAAYDDLVGRIDAMSEPFAAMNELSKRVADADAALKTLAGDVARQRAAADEARAELTRSISGLYERAPATDLDFALAQAESLVLAAGERLALEQDVRSAIAALLSADERLKSANHPDLIAVRERIASDLNALRGVSMPDAEGLALQASDLIARTDELPVRELAQLASPAQVLKEQHPASRGLSDKLGGVWHDLAKLVEIKDAEVSDRLLFDPELRAQARELIKLELAVLRLAVMRRDTRNAHASAERIAGWLRDYFDFEAAPVRQLTEWLRTLMDTELSPALPDVNGSLDAIRARRMAAHSPGGG
jgi:uncharacterized protein HemX